MSELYKIKCKFQDFEEKKVTETFTVRRATFEIDNTYGDNKGRMENVPFECYGKSWEVAQTLKINQEAEISFRVGGNKGFVKLSAVTIIPGKEDVPF